MQVWGFWRLGVIVLAWTLIVTVLVVRLVA
jgi:hypothetical protein